MKNTKEVVQHCFSMILVGHQAAQQIELAMVERDARIAELEAAIDKLAQCKGRFHAEANFKALIAIRAKGTF